MSSIDDTYDPSSRGARQTENEVLQATVDSEGNVSYEETGEVEGDDGSEKKEPLQNQETSDVDSQTKAEKNFISEEYSTLTGELKIVPNAKTLKINSGETVELKGFGKYLSGNYFIEKVSRSISSTGGYSHSLTLRKNGFGSLKDESTTPAEDSTETRETPEEVELEVEGSDEE